MKRTTFLSVLLLVGAGGWYYWAPRAAADRLREAALAGDERTLERLVDFPRVRQNLKADLRAEFAEQADPVLRDHPLIGAVAAGLGGPIADGAVERLVTPSAIAALARWGQDEQGGPVDDSDVAYRMRNTGLSEFVVTARSRHDRDAEPVTFTFGRSGLQWRLVRVWSDEFTHR